MPPVAFDQDPAAAAVDPVMGNPDPARMRRTVPAPRDPDVTGSVPTLIAGDPHVAGMRWPAIVLMDRGWGPYPDHNAHLGHGGRGNHNKREQYCQNGLFHG